MAETGDKIGPFEVRKKSIDTNDYLVSNVGYRGWVPIAIIDILQQWINEYLEDVVEVEEAKMENSIIDVYY